jgi:hypothetical protein
MGMRYTEATIVETIMIRGGLPMKNGWTYMLLVAAAIFWGASFNTGKSAVQAMPPMKKSCQ